MVFLLSQRFNKSIFVLMSRISPVLILSLLFSSCIYYIGPNHWANSFSKDEVIVPHRKSVEEIAADDGISFKKVGEIVNDH